MAIAEISSLALAARRRPSSPEEPSQAQCSSSRAARSPMPSPVPAAVLTIGGFQSPAPYRAIASIVRRSLTASWAPGRSLLFTTKMSAISRMPALAAWIESPIPGATTTSVESASDAISTSAWPTPTVSTRTTSKPAASRIRKACGAALESPPRCPRLAIDLMNTPLSVA